MTAARERAGAVAAGEAASRGSGPEATDPFRGSGASSAAGALPGPVAHVSGKSREPGGSREPEESRDSREPEHPGRKAVPSVFVIPAQAGIQTQVEQEKAEGDSQARELVAAWEQGGRVDLAGAARRLEAALHDIDRAGICTIHGFCQRALADLAFESGFPFGFEVSGSDAGMVAAAVRDFWRRRLYPASTLLVRHAVESGFLPGGLTEWTSRRRAGVAEVRGGEPPAESIEEREAAWRREFEAVRAEWTQHRETFRTEILDGDWLNRRSYGRKKVEEELEGLEALFAAAEPRLPPPDLAARYGRGRLSQPQSVKKGFTLPEHPIFDAFDRLEEASEALRATCDQWLRWAHRDMLDEVRASVRRRVREDRRLGYDDLLSELGDALAGSHGERLAARIRHEYPCALIDEFQDTDPVQAAIFTRVYGEGHRGTGQEAADPAVVGGEHHGGGDHGEGQEAAGAGRLFIVGDPKQSIYRFRGADVYAYLAARRPARERLALGQNWRSVPALVEAVNAVFAAPDAFVIPGIPYRPVAAARSGGNPLRIAPGGDGAGAPSEFPPGSAGVVPPPSSSFPRKRESIRPGSAGVSPATGGGAAGTPFEFRLLPDPEEARKHRSKEGAHRIAAEAAANEIARLLNLAGRGEATIGAEPLTGADVAVLVRTRAQGRLVAEALRARGVRSVEIDDRSVFETDEAEQVERLLWVLAEPGREARVRGALAGVLFGLDAVALHALDEDEAAWSGWAERIAGWRSDWEARGIGPLLLKLLDGEGGAKRLLARPGGVRRLTNFRHLADLLQEAETGGRLAPVELAVWLSRSRSAATGVRTADESAQLRLESDEALVRILTVHAAKGLEFPIVFCPFVWDARARGRGNEGDVAYHLDATTGYREVLDLDPDARARSIARVEEFAESVRLLYVALTRAKYRCVVTWGQVGGAESAPLTWLLHRDRSGPAPAAGPGGGSESGFEGVRAGGEPGAGPGRGEPDDGSESGSEAGGVGGEPERRPGAGEPGDGSESGFEVGGASGGPKSGFDVSGASGGPEGVLDALVARGEPERRPSAEEPDDGPESGGDTGWPDAAAAVLKATADRFRGLSASDWRGEIEGFAQRFPNAIRVTVLDADPPPIRAPAFPEGPPPVLAAREPGRPLRRIRQLTSFTALSAEALAAGSGRPAAEGDDAEVDRPDHDQHEAPADDAGEDTDAAGGAGRGRTAFTFPRGPVAGSCLHRIFERLDEPSGVGPDKPGLDTICRETLEDFGIDGEWSPAARVMVERTRAVRLHERGWEGPDGGAGFHLGDPAIRRLVELEFHFPVKGLDRERLAARLVEHGYPHPFARPARDGAGEPLPPIHGFLRGYVDLVVEHAGRWYILDYKSNWLGPAPADYGPEALDAAVRASGYPLQYLIYLVALHRYLATRLPGYDYERHVGGAFYLFVRGIDPAAGMCRGVYFDRPSAACLHALDECFGRGVT